MQRAIHEWAVVIVAGALLTLPRFSEAHHSTAEFDYSKTVVLQGKVKEVQWMNPHSYVQLLVSADGGATVEWAVEIGAPLFNMRMGWKPSSVQVGDVVAMNVVPARNGSPHGSLRTLTFADGRKLPGPASTVGSDSEGFAVFGAQQTPQPEAK
jgi:hypothetical protein